MSLALDVRDLCVLFGGTHRAGSEGTYSASVLMSDAVTVRVPGYQLGLLGVDFTVKGGECLAVLGASGSGKSSLLRTLAGLQPAGRGTVLVNGNDVSTLPPEQRSTVYLHQEPVLFPHLSVLENVAFPMMVRGVEKQLAVARAIEWLRRLQVVGVFDFPPEALSGGQRHRVALARALCADPAVLLLDEPLASLDPAVRRDVRDALLEARAASGAAMVLVTHDLDDALAVSTHIAAIEGVGQLSAPASPAAILEHPPSLETARVLGVYTEVVGEVVSTSDGSVFRWIGGKYAAPGCSAGPAVACVRSHEVEVLRGDQLAAPGLTVTARRDGAHDALLTVQDALGAQASVRVGSGIAVGVSEVVHIALRHARVFPATPPRHV